MKYLDKITLVVHCLATQSYPVGEEGAAGLPHENLGDRVDAVWSDIEAPGQLILIHAST